jgi:hypothetical protein
MNMRNPWVAGRQAVILATALLVSVAGCTRGGDDPEGGDPGDTSYIGALPMPADDMSTAEFRSFTDSVKANAGGGDTTDRPCTGAGGCGTTPPTQFARVFVGAVSDANRVPRDHTHANGVVVAWFEHRAGPNEARYGFLPNHQYYVVLFPGGSYRLRQVNPGGVHQWHGVARRYSVCQPEHDPGNEPSEARWLSCAEAHRMRTGAVAMTLVASAGQEALAEEILPWIRCPYGCCYPDPVLE